MIQAREYVNKIEGRFKPTVLGRMLVEKLLSPAFDDILEVNYTRELEEVRQDRRGEGELRVHPLQLLSQVREGSGHREEAHAQLKEGEPDPPVACDKCGKPMVIKAGKFGLFLACSGYPECENTRELETPDVSGDGDSRRRARTAASR